MPETGTLGLIAHPAARSSPRFAPPRVSTKLAEVSPEPPDDGTLMLRYGAGDAGAFEELYSRHRAPLWRFVLRSLHDETATADVFQDVWMRVISHRGRYTPTAKFTTWLYRIAHHCCVDYWRRAGRTTQREHPAGEEVLASLADSDAARPDAAAQEEEQAAALQAALRELPEAQRCAFLLYVEAGLALADIAAVTDVGVETAKSRLRYATARLRSALAGE